MLKVENVTMEYSKLLFREVSFILGNREKVGLVGLNGTGKSTLLRIIAGEETPLSGEVHLVNERVEYLPQEFDLSEKGKYEFLGELLEDLVDDPYSQLWKVHKILSTLDFGEIDEFAPVRTLSPGMQMKVYLAKLLMSDPTILLLDEPTNHLDIKGIEWFESFVKKFEGICIIISHDRDFLNNTTNRIFEIDEYSLSFYEGNYDDYVAEREARIAERAKTYQLQERKRQKLEQLLENSRKLTDAKQRGKAVRAAKKRMQREVLRNEIDEYEQKDISHLAIDGSVHSSKRILEISNLTFSYDKEKKLIENCNLEMYGSEKIWIKGPNGTGKSTLIKLINGELEPDGGEIKWGTNLKWTYFTQEQRDLQIDEKVQHYFFKKTDIVWEKSYGILEKYLFDRDLRNVPVRKLSPGQKSRLAFAIFSQQNYDFLILDEPTNHLDIQTKESIERALREFKGAILLVSHDRFFSNQIKPNQVLKLQDGRLVKE